MLWKTRLISGGVVFVVGFLYAAQAVTLPSLPEEGVQGRGIFQPESISYGHSPFGTSVMTRGTLEWSAFETEHWKKIPCTIYTPPHKKRPPGDAILVVQGRLLPKTYPHYVLKPKEIESQKSIFSLAEWRFQMKERMRTFFSSLFPRKETAAFLLSMVTGDIDDRLMALQFNRLGLLHLLGVSGFQFALLALVLGYLLRMILPLTFSRYALITLLSIYAFTLGNSPPVQRAYLSVTLYTIAQLFGLQITAMNALGAALIWELLLDPCVIFQLGFQFSFLCTAAIFAVYPSFRDFLKRWLSDRSFSELRSLPLLDRWGHTLSFFLREAVALNLAIHLVSLPLILYHFHKFPLLSLIYNLFLPLLVSLAYLCLLPGLFLELFSHLLAWPFLKIAEGITDLSLLAAAYPPTLFDFQCRLPSFGLTAALLSLTALFLLFYERGRLFDRLFRR